MSELGPIVFIGAGVVIAVVAMARLAGHPVRQPGLLTLLLGAAAYTGVTAIIFSVRPEEIHFLLSTAAYRTMIFVRLVVVLDVILACVAGVRALGGLPLGQPASDEDALATVTSHTGNVPA